MAYFEFYINDKERKEIVKYILSKNTKIVIDKLYPSKNYEILKTEDELIDNLNKGHIRYFLIDDTFTIEPLTNSKNNFFEEPTFSIYQRKGGPYIDLVFYLGYSEDATIKYKRSEIDHYSKFIHYNNFDEFKVSDEVKLYYKEIVKFIKSKCNPIKKNNKTYWIGKEVIKENEIYSYI